MAETKTSDTNLGTIGYEAYAKYTGNKTFDDRDMPQWADLGELIQSAWMVAGEAVQRAVISHGGLSDEHGDCQLCRIIARQ